MKADDEIISKCVSRVSCPAAIIFVITLVVYIPAMLGGPIWDDDYWLEKNPVLQAGDAPLGYWTSNKTADYLPVTATFFWLQQQIFGENYAGYHTVNVILHAAAAVLLWRVLAMLAIPGAWLAGLIFAVHPVAASSAGWISEQKNTLSMVFYAAAILSYLKFDDSPARPRWYLIALVMFAIAGLTKSSIIVLPAVLLACAWWRRGKIALRDIVRSSAFFAIAAVIAVLTVLYQHGNAMDTNVDTPANLLERLMVAGQSIWFYLYKALAPTRLVMIYPRWDIHTISAVRLAPIILLLVTIVVVLKYRNSWARPLAMGLGYYFIGLLPVLGFFDMSIMMHSFVADHLQYVSLIGVTALVTGLGWRFASRRARAVRWICAAAAAAIVAVLGVLTFQQAQRLADNTRLWEHNLTHNDMAYAAHVNLASALINLERLDEAHQHYLKAQDIRPDYDKVQNNIGLLYAKQEKYDQAVPYYLKAIELNPRYSDAHENLGVTLARLKRYEQAAEHFRQSIRHRFKEDSNTKRSVRHDHLASALVNLGQFDSAIFHYAEALQLNPKNTHAAGNMAVALTKWGDKLLDENRIGQAIAKYRRAIKIEPDNADRWFHVGRRLVDLGKFNDASEFLLQAERLRGGLATSQFQLGKEASAHRKFDEAIKHYRIAAGAKPNYTAAMNNLAWILAVEANDNLRSGVEAIALAERACKASDYRVTSLVLCLSAAYGEAGRFEDAAATLEKAIQLATANDQTEKVRAMRELLKFYKNGKNYRHFRRLTQPQEKKP